MPSFQNLYLDASLNLYLILEIFSFIRYNFLSLSQVLSGMTSHGVVEPSEAAEQIIAETLARFLAQFKKAQQLAMKNRLFELLWGPFGSIIQ